MSNDDVLKWAEEALKQASRDPANQYDKLAFGFTGWDGLRYSTYGASVKKEVKPAQSDADFLRSVGVSPE